MTNDLQDRLRDDLADLTAGPLDLGIDLDDVLRSGRRVSRARDARLAIGGVSLATAAAVLALSGVAWPGTSMPPVVPAAPASSQAWIENPAYFDVSGLHMESTTPFRKVQLAIDPTWSGWNVQVTTSRADGMLLSQFTYRAQPGVSIQQISPQVAIALLPSRTAWWDVALKDPQYSLMNDDSMHPGGLDLTAVLLVFDKPGHIDNVAGFIWEAADGTLVDSLGSTVPTARMAFSGQDVTMFRDEGLHQIGFRTPNGFWTSWSTTMDWPSAYPRLQYFEQVPGEHGHLWVLADVLPEGAHDLGMTFTTDQAAFTTADLGGRPAYVIVATTDTTDQPITSLSYLDASGKKVSYRQK